MPDKTASPEAYLPIAQAIPCNAETGVVVVSSSSANNFTMIDLPIQSAGFHLAGSPVRLGDVIDKDLKLPNDVDGKWYVHSIQILPDLEVTHLTDAEMANRILRSNKHLHRRLGVGREVPVLNFNDGFYYTHTLPVPASLPALQIKLNGFPPHVVNVEDASPLAGKLHPRQVLVELRIPGRPTLDVQTPGFTAYKVGQELKSCSNVSGIRFTVKDELKTVKKEKGSSNAFDDCVIL